MSILPYFDGPLGTLSTMWQHRNSLSHDECRNGRNKSHVEGRDLVSKYCLVDIQSGVSALEEYVKYNKSKSTEEFLHRLCHQMPHCFHPQLWVQYLKYLIQSETGALLGKCITLPCSQAYFKFLTQSPSLKLHWVTFPQLGKWPSFTFSMYQRKRKTTLRRGITSLLIDQTLQSNYFRTYSGFILPQVYLDPFLCCQV